MRCYIFNSRCFYSSTAGVAYIASGQKAVLNITSTYICTCVRHLIGLRTIVYIFRLFRNRTLTSHLETRGSHILLLIHVITRIIHRIFICFLIPGSRGGPRSHGFGLSLDRSTYSPLLSSLLPSTHYYCSAASGFQCILRFLHHQ